MAKKIREVMDHPKDNDPRPVWQGVVKVSVDIDSNDDWCDRGEETFPVHAADVSEACRLAYQREQQYWVDAPSHVRQYHARTLVAIIDPDGNRHPLDS